MVSCMLGLLSRAHHVGITGLVGGTLGRTRPEDLYSRSADLSRKGGRSIELSRCLNVTVRTLFLTKGLLHLHPALVRHEILFSPATARVNMGIIVFKRLFHFSIHFLVQSVFHFTSIASEVK